MHCEHLSVMGHGTRPAPTHLNSDAHAKPFTRATESPGVEQGAAQRLAHLRASSRQGGWLSMAGRRLANACLLPVTYTAGWGMAVCMVGLALLGTLLHQDYFFNAPVAGPLAA